MGTMKKILSVVLGLFMLLMLPEISFSADPGPYVSGRLGMAFLEDSDVTDNIDTITLEFDTGYALGVAVGHNFGMFRLEGEFGYQQNDIEEASAYGYSASAYGDINCFSLLINGYFDFVNTSPLTPYIGLGIGMARIEVKSFEIAGYRIGSDDDTVFAYQLGGGVGYAMNENVTLDLQYRYFATEDPEFGVVDAEYATHNVYFGLRYNF
jgi:opacity protein-like surface antigen